VKLVRGSRLKSWAAVLAVGLAATGGPAAGSSGIDPTKALPILLRVLTYDRNFKSRGNGEFVVLVPAEAGKESARDEVLIAAKTMNLDTIHNRPLKFVGMDLKEASALDDLVQKTRAQAIIAVAGLSPASVKAISDVAQTNQIYSLAMDPKFAESSLALGVAAKEDGNFQPVINLSAAKAVGAVFENSVLKLAKLVQEPK
jgi:hypothetical protein